VEKVRQPDEVKGQAVKKPELSSRHVQISSWFVLGFQPLIFSLTAGKMPVLAPLLAPVVLG